MFRRMRVRYDPEVNATYVTLAEGVVARTIELSDSVMVDVDQNGDPLGVEVLGRSIMSQSEIATHIARIEEDERALGDGASFSAETDRILRESKRVRRRFLAAFPWVIDRS